MCTHFWLTDSKGFGRCKHCGATKQFKGYEMPKLKPGAMGKFNAREYFVDPDLCAKSYVRVPWLEGRDDRA